MWRSPAEENCSAVQVQWEGPQERLKLKGCSQYVQCVLRGFSQGEKNESKESACFKMPLSGRKQLHVLQPGYAMNGRILLSYNDNSNTYRELRGKRVLGILAAQKHSRWSIVVWICCRTVAGIETR